MTITRRLAYGLPLAAAALAATLAGCTSSPSTQSEKPPSITLATAPTTTSTPPVAPPQTTNPPTTTAAPTHRPPCPVSKATLEAAFHASAVVSNALVLGNGLKNITCYQRWATAFTSPTDVDTAMVLFVHDQSGWKAVTGGTFVHCNKWVPAAAIAHLPGCVTE